MSLLARNHGKARLLRFLLTCSWPEMHMDIENSFLIGCWYLFWAATSNLKRFFLDWIIEDSPQKIFLLQQGQESIPQFFVPVWLHSGHAASDCKEWRLAHTQWLARENVAWKLWKPRVFVRSFFSLHDFCHSTQVGSACDQDEEDGDEEVGPFSAKFFCRQFLLPVGGARREELCMEAVASWFFSAR